MTFSFNTNGAKYVWYENYVKQNFNVFFFTALMSSYLLSDDSLLGAWTLVFWCVLTSLSFALWIFTENCNEDQVRGRDHVTRDDLWPNSKERGLKNRMTMDTSDEILIPATGRKWNKGGRKVELKKLEYAQEKESQDLPSWDCTTCSSSVRRFIHQTWFSQNDNKHN